MVDEIVTIPVPTAAPTIMAAAPPVATNAAIQAANTTVATAPTINFSPISHQGVFSFTTSFSTGA